MNATKTALFLAGLIKITMKDIQLICNEENDYEKILNLSEKDLKIFFEENHTKTQAQILLEEWIYRKNNVDLEKEQDYLVNNNISLCAFWDEDYPQTLFDIPDYPFCLFYKGSLPLPEIPSVAIIGSRSCSEYGIHMAKELGKAIANYGINVISGMARGIDGVSQRAALNAGGSSYGILGSGVDICYPKENQPLYDELIKNGGVISEYYPKTQPLSINFPQRNRIISGLSDALVVVEARKKSGTSITVTMALEQGKDIYAVPGRLTDNLSLGCNNLIKDGAGIILDPDEFAKSFLEQYALSHPKFKSEQRKSYLNTSRFSGGLTSIQRCILRQLDFTPTGVDELLSKVNLALLSKKLDQLSLSMLQFELLALLASGKVQTSGNYYYLI